MSRIVSGRVGERSVWRCVCALVLLCALACADDKRAELQPAPFVLGSRYGRSPQPPRILAPRNDRFFMGSRYGKRSEPLATLMSPALARELLPPPPPPPPPPAARLLLCEYTGMLALYKCSGRHEPAFQVQYTDRRREEDVEEED